MDYLARLSNFYSSVLPRNALLFSSAPQADDGLRPQCFDSLLCLDIRHEQRNCLSRVGKKPYAFNNGIVHYLSRLEIQQMRPWLLQPLFTSCIELDGGYSVGSKF